MFWRPFHKSFERQRRNNNVESKTPLSALLVLSTQIIIKPLQNAILQIRQSFAALKSEKRGEGWGICCTPIMLRIYFFLKLTPLDFPEIFQFSINFPEIFHSQFQSLPIKHHQLVWESRNFNPYPLNIINWSESHAISIPTH